jgi:hypothetical protein
LTVGEGAEQWVKQSGYDVKTECLSGSGHKKKPQMQGSVLDREDRTTKKSQKKGEKADTMSRRNAFLDPDIKKKPRMQRSVLDKEDRTTKKSQKKR